MNRLIPTKILLSTFLSLTPLQTTRVDDIRNLDGTGYEFLPKQVSHKVYIIDEVHMLSTAAFNALLKTLEEPPKHCNIYS